MEDEGAVQRMTTEEKRKRVEAAAGIANALEFVSVQKKNSMTRTVRDMNSKSC